MTKKETFIPIAIFALTALFVLVSVMVYLSKGQSAKWVNRKMKIGALLLSLNYISCGNNQRRYENTCYVVVDLSDTSIYLPPIPPPPLNANPEIQIEFNNNRIIYGNIKGKIEDEFSFTLHNHTGEVVTQSKIILKTYAFDPENQEFVIELNKNLDTGNYRLKLFNSKINGQDTAIMLKEFDIRIQ